MDLRLLTLGGLSVHGPTGPIAGAAAQPRRLAVLALVARGGRRGVSRARLLALLWPDAAEEQGRRVLAQALYALRRDLGDERALVGGQEVRLNPDVLWCDVGAFEAALERGATEDAAALYVGPFLDGFRLPNAPEFERWADDARLALQHRLHDALEILARDAESDGAHDRAVAWWRRRAADDPLNARVATRLMRALAAVGDRHGALLHARLFEALLAAELALPPDREVTALANELRREEPPVAPRVAASRTGAIAVLPLVHLGIHADDEHQRRWREGLAEEVINHLMGSQPMRVMARTASFALGAAPPMDALRAEPGVSLALEGSVRRSDSAVRVTVRLLDVARGHAVWSGRYEHAVAETVAAQDQIARAISDGVCAHVEVQ